VLFPAEISNHHAVFVSPSWDASQGFPLLKSNNPTNSSRVIPVGLVFIAGSYYQLGLPAYIVSACGGGIVTGM